MDDATIQQLLKDQNYPGPQAQAPTTPTQTPTPTGPSGEPYENVVTGGWDAARQIMRGAAGEVVPIIGAGQEGLHMIAASQGPAQAQEVPAPTPGGLTTTEGWDKLLGTDQAPPADENALSTFARGAERGLGAAAVPVAAEAALAPFTGGTSLFPIIPTLAGGAIIGGTNALVARYAPEFSGATRFGLPLLMAPLTGGASLAAPVSSLARSGMSTALSLGAGIGAHLMGFSELGSVAAGIGMHAADRIATTMLHGVTGMFSPKTLARYGQGVVSGTVGGDSAMNYSAPPSFNPPTPTYLPVNP